MSRPIKNDEQYEDALERIYNLLQKEVEPGSAEGDELEVLSILVKDYENIHYPMPKPNPIEAIKFRLEQMDMTEADLSTILGYRSRKSEILFRKKEIEPEHDPQVKRAAPYPCGGFDSAVLIINFLIQY